MKKRMIALLLCLCLCMTLLPIQGLALEGDGGTQEPASPRLLWRFDLYVSAEDTMEPQPRLEVENLPDPKKFPDGTTAFQFPCQPGKTGTIAVESADAFKDATIKVTQNGKELENLNDLNGGSTFHADKVSLEKGSTITITGEKNGAASQYTIELVEKDAPSFTVSPISGAGPGYKLTPAFNKNQREYVLTVPADAETLAFSADPGDGREFQVIPRNSSGSEIEYYMDAEGSGEEYRERYKGYWCEREDVMLVPLVGYWDTDEEPKQAAELEVEIREDHVYQSYRFRIIRAEPGTAELTDDLFGVKQLLFYDGKPHSADLMIVSSVLDKDKLTFAFDDASTEVIEKLASVTDAGTYNVHVSYAGDDVYAPVTDKELRWGQDYPLNVSLHKAELEVVNTLPAGNKLTLTYSPVAQEVDIPELKVVDASGKEVAGTWNVYKTTSAGTNYNANADFQFADESMSRNYYVGSVRINLTQTPLVLSQEDLIKDLQIDSSEQDPEQGFVYPYTPSGYYQFPRVSVWTLGTLMRYLNNNGTEYEYFKVKYSFHDKDGSELGEDDGVKINKNTGYPESGPTAVGEYKLRLTVPVSSLHSSLRENVKFKDDEDIVYDIPYEIVPREITPKVLLNATVYRIDENRIIVSPDIDCHDELGPDVFTFFKTEFKFGNKVIQPNSSGRYDPYDLTTTGNDPNFTFTISLKDENENNYILSEDSVLTAFLNPNGERVTPVASSDAVVVHKYDGNSYTNEKDLSGTINLQGLPAGKDVSCRIAGIALENSNGWTVTAPGDNYKATVHLMLTGKDAGDYLLSTDTITVPASIVKRSLNDPDVYIWVNNPSMTYYESSEEPFEPLVRVNVQGSTIASGDKTYKVTYLNNIYPSVRGSGEEGVYAKAVVTAAEGGYFTGSVTKDFYIG